MAYAEPSLGRLLHAHGLKRLWKHRVIVIAGLTRNLVQYQRDPESSSG